MPQILGRRARLRWMCHEFCQLAFDFRRKIRFEAVFGHRLALGRAQVKRPDLRVMMRAHTPPWSCKAGAIKTTLLYFFAARTPQAGKQSRKGASKSPCLCAR